LRFGIRSLDDLPRFEIELDCFAVPADVSRELAVQLLVELLE
jgi:hypothetical protein